MKYEVSAELFQAIANIIGSLPYGQVFQVMDEIRRLKPIENEKVEVAAVPQRPPQK